MLMNEPASSPLPSWMPSRPEVRDLAEAGLAASACAEATAGGGDAAEEDASGVEPLELGQDRGVVGVVFGARLAADDLAAELLELGRERVGDALAERSRCRR